MPRCSQDTCSQSTCPTFCPFNKILHHLLSETSLIIDQGSHISCKWATRYLNRKDVQYDSSKEMRTTQVCEECKRSVGRSLWEGCERKPMGRMWKKEEYAEGNEDCVRGEEVSVGGRRRKRRWVRVNANVNFERRGCRSYGLSVGLWMTFFFFFFFFVKKMSVNFLGTCGSLSCVLLS